MAIIKDIRGGAAGIEATEIVDGQRLYDLDEKRIYIDRIVDGTPERVMMGEAIFHGTTTDWETLPSDEKDKYTYVDLTDDYEYKTTVFTGATSDHDGDIGLVPKPYIADRNSFLKGDGTWDPLVCDTAMDSTSHNPVENRVIATELDKLVPKSRVGQPLGLATLDSTGRIPSEQLPGSVGYVVEEPTVEDFPAVGDIYTMYVALDTNKVYRWSGTQYTEISKSLALGETSDSAYAGDKGAVCYAHAYTNKGSAFSNGLYKITTNAEGHVTNAVAVTKNDIIGLGIPGETYEYSITECTGTYASLTEFVQASAKGKLVANFKFTDTSNIFGLGASVVVKGYIRYQNAYNGVNNVLGNGMLYLGATEDPYAIMITGTTSFTLKKKQMSATKTSIGLGNVDNLDYKKLLTYSNTKPTGVWAGCAWISST